MTWFQGKAIKVQTEKSGVQQKEGAFNTNFEGVFPWGSNVLSHKMSICPSEFLDTVFSSTQQLMSYPTRMAGEGSIRASLSAGRRYHITPCDICGLGINESY